MKSVLTADLGGTKCRFAVVAEDLSVLGATQFDTTLDRAALLGGMGRTLTALAATRWPGVDPPCALGIGTAGVVDPAGERVHSAPNLPIAGLDLAAHFRALLGVPTTVMNDGRCSALGEFRHGHAAGADPLLVLFFGTGVGIGLIVGGRPYAGASNAAGEIGHTIHRPGGRLGPNGRAGTFEAYCGGGPMGRRALDELGPSPSGGGAWRVGEILAARARDPRAAAILLEAEVAAGALVANACTVLNPAAVVLGGGVLQGWPELRGNIERFVREHCSPVITATLRFVPSRGESDAILWGAAEATGRLW